MALSESGANPTKNDKDDITVSVWGKSETLKKDSRPDDARLIKRVLRKDNNI